MGSGTNGTGASMQNATAFLLSMLVAVAATAAAARAAAPYQEVRITNGGTIRGKVNIGSARPRVERYIIAKDSQVCGSTTRDVPLVRARGDALLDAVVYLKNVKRGKPFRAAAKKVTIDQRNCVFEPSLSVIVDGGELEAVNSDPILHNIHVYALGERTRQTVMNASQPQKGNIVAKRMHLGDTTAMKVECDAHNFMHAHVFVARNPYYAIVDDNGEFEIGNVPPGTYTITVWHGVLGERRAEVAVSGGAETAIDFAY
jgi:plastocyanin